MTPRTTAAPYLRFNRCLRLLFAVILLAAAATAWNARAAEPMTLNMKDADITAFIGTVSQLTGKNFIVDPRVKGKITVISSHNMDEKQIYQVFLSVLEVHGFAAVPAGSVIKIIPQANARQEAIPTMSENHPTQRGDEYVTQVLALQNVSAAQLVPILRPLVPQQGHLVAYPPGNILIITDEAANIRRLTTIIDRIDVPNSEEIEIIPLKHASATEVVRILTTLEQQRGQERGQPRVPGAASGSLLIADERTNSILMGGDKSDRLRLRAVITQLDTPMVESGGNIHVVYLNYAKAKDLVTVLQGIASTSTKQKGKAPAPPSDKGVSIQADESTNSLVIWAPPDLFRSLQAVIRQLDVRRVQVYVEATIAEVTNNIARELGVQWAAGNPEGAGTLGVANLATSGGLSIGQAAAAVAAGDASAFANLPQGLTFGVGKIGNGTFDYAALLRLLAGDSNTNILSTPSLVTMDNEEAEIVVGQNVPFVTGSFTTTGSTGSVNNPFQTIQRQDVGLTLKVKPQINEGNAIKMDIDQEVSSIAPAPAGVSASDIITNKRSIKTSVLVESGQIIVLGGLIQNDLKQSQQKIPLLGDIPILGYLFRYNNTTKDKTDLMVFIHPVILRDAGDNMRITGGKYDYIRAQQDMVRERGVRLLSDKESPLLPPLQDYLSLPPPYDDGQAPPPKGDVPPPPPPGDSGAPQQR